MKRCPKCRKRYADESLNFCLEDGTPLIAEPDSEPTLISPTVASRATTPWTGASSPPSLSPPAPSSNRWILLGVVVGLALLLGGGAVALLYQFTNSPSTNDRKEVASSPGPETRPTTERGTATPRVDPTPAAPIDLSGEWDLVNTIQQTSYPAYTNLRVGYHLVIHQNGNEFTADGEKVSENGAAMADSERTPIHVTGSIDFDQEIVTATFVEEGLRRQTSGRFAWTIIANRKEMRGTFVSTAARSSGSSVVVRRALTSQRLLERRLVAALHIQRFCNLDAITLAAVAPAPTAPAIVGASEFATSPTAKTFSTLVSCSLLIKT